MAASQLRIASRRSQLAMVQTHWVRDELTKAHPGLEISIEAMATQGDKILDVALAKIGDKGLFTKELEAQMLVDRADIEAHVHRSAAGGTARTGGQHAVERELAARQASHKACSWPAPPQSAWAVRSIFGGQTQPS